MLKAFPELLEDVSSKVHVWVQVYGFIWSFIIGFLGTAVPRLTRTTPLHAVTVILLMLLSCSSVVAVLAQKFLWAHLLFLATLAVLLVCLVVRFRRRNPRPARDVHLPAVRDARRNPRLRVVRRRAARHALEPEPHAGDGREHGLPGRGDPAHSRCGWIPRALDPRLARALPTTDDGIPQIDPATVAQRIAHAACARRHPRSFWLEAFVHESLGAGLRAALVTAEAVWQMQIHRKPVSGKLTSHWLRWAVWLIVVGLWAGALAPAQARVACLHLCFAGGFTLVIIGIATRVTLSHGGYSAMLKRSYRPLSVAAVLILIGMITRFVVDIIPMETTRHLAYAALAWCLGLLVFLMNLN